MKTVFASLSAASLAIAVAGCAATTATTSAPSDAAAPVAVTTTAVALTAPDGRPIDLTVIAPAQPRGVILFSHGGGSAPAANRALLESMAAKGFAVLAPTHTDSTTLPAERRSTLQAALGTRIADMQVAAGHAGKIWPALPLAEVGYSYGSLTALMGAGALSGMIPGTIPGVKAVVMFSSPGPIAPLTAAPGAFARVTAPTLLVTGTADVVPGMVADPKSHLVYFDTLPAGDHTALIVTGADHGFVAGTAPAWNAVAALAGDFLASRVLGDKVAGARFDTAKTTPQLEVRRR